MARSASLAWSVARCTARLVRIDFRRSVASVELPQLLHSSVANGRRAHSDEEGEEGSEEENTLENLEVHGDRGALGVFKGWAMGSGCTTESRRDKHPHFIQPVHRR